MPLRKSPLYTMKSLQQRGAAAIEFALVFPFILLLFYGIFSYSLILLHKQAVTSISAEAARSALAAGDATGIGPAITKTINGHAWVSDRIVGCEGGGDEYFTLGADNQLHICLVANLPPMPKIDLGFVSLPPTNTAEMLTTTTTVKWQP